MIGHLAAIAGSVAVLIGTAAAFISRRLRKGHGISIVIPFRVPKSGKDQRVKNFVWLLRYWKHQLPGAEIIVGRDMQHDLPFSKSAAVNDAAARAKGDILVIVDADGYISIDAVLHCAKEIREAQGRGQRLWFVPYRKFYRLNETASRHLLSSDPANPLKFSVPPCADDLQPDAHDPARGHWYGAMIQIVPREAFEIVGGWDERFRGWGGEDYSAMRACDTLYAPHKTLSGQVLHMWHPQIGPKGAEAYVSWKNRMWEEQKAPHANANLTNRYNEAYLKPVAMRKLVNEGREGKAVDNDGRHRFPRKPSM
jgi:hypothetical protein